MIANDYRPARYLVRWRDADDYPRGEKAWTAQDACALAALHGGVAIDLQDGTRIADCRAEMPEQQCALRLVARWSLRAGAICLLVSGACLVARPHSPHADELWIGLLGSVALLSLAWGGAWLADRLERWR